MRRSIVLVKVVLLMTAMMVVSSGAAHGKGVCEACTFDFVGNSLPTVVCESSVATSPLIGWRDGQCWVFHPASVDGFQIFSGWGGYDPALYLVRIHLSCLDDRADAVEADVRPRTDCNDTVDTESG